MTTSKNPELNPSIKEKTATTGNTRVTGKEQFYTPEATADQIFVLLKKMGWLTKSLTLLEPAGGTGNIIKAARKFGIKDVVSYDIEPRNPEVQFGNFLEQDISQTGMLTITNPPFGRNNSLAIPFFNHAAKFSDYIVFIVPRSWRKWSVQNKLDRNFHLVRDEDLAINYVNELGEDAHAKDRLRTCIQFWKRETTPRKIVAVKDMGIFTKCAPTEADASFTIFGYGCGSIKTEFQPVKNTTQMFVKFLHPEALAAFNDSDFSKFFMNTAYTEALALPEINYVLNEHIFGDPMLIDKD